MISGIIEGFYGPPWSHETRLDFIALGLALIGFKRRRAA